MPTQGEHPEFQGWQWLVGSLATEATHPGLPDTWVSGTAALEWFEDQQFLIHRTRYDHPQLPDAVAVIGVVAGEPSMHYFDVRGVHRTFAVAITADTWRYWNAPRLRSRSAAPAGSATTAPRSTAEGALARRRHLAGRPHDQVSPDRLNRRAAPTPVDTAADDVVRRERADG
jgi:hypothetical protein